MNEIESSSCIFCRIARDEVPSQIVQRDDEVVAFEDLDPQAPRHVLVIPRRHISSVDDLDPGDAELAGRVLLASAEIARREGFAANGYRLVTNVGKDGGQSVDHWHVHLLAGRALSWPPG
ncbi:MAG: histidine triad nucleotide-binding protein [Gemmatimonadota bacterium]